MASKKKVSVEYNADGVQNVFAVPFIFNVNTDILVTQVVIASGVATPLVLDMDYEVTGGNGAAGSVITFSTPEGGHKVVIERSATAKVDVLEDKTEAQIRIAAILLAAVGALGQIFPGKVSDMGDLWENKIAVRVEDTKEILIEFTTNDSIEAHVTKYQKEASGTISSQPIAKLKLAMEGNIDAIQGFTKHVVIEAANAVYIHPDQFVEEIAVVASDYGRMRAALAQKLRRGTAAVGEGVPAPKFFEPVSI